MILRLLPWLLTAACWAVAAWWWPQAGDHLPVHWGIDGTPDRYGSRVEAVLLFPVLLTVLNLALEVVPRLDPARASFAQMRGAWITLRIGLAAVLTTLYTTMAVGGDVGRVAPITLGALLCALGSVLGKIRPNYTFGIRLPWTLASKRAWTVAHRVGGWLFLGHGILVVGAALRSSRAAAYTFFGGLAPVLVVVAVVAWRAWSQDPDRITPGGTTPA